MFLNLHKFSALLRGTFFILLHDARFLLGDEQVLTCKPLKQYMHFTIS